VTFSLIFDGVLAALLTATIAYAVILNRKLTELRQSRGEMERLIAEFAEATQQAEQGVGVLRERADEAQATLDERVSAAESRLDEARKLADDLAFMLDRGGKLADRLEMGVTGAIKSTEAPAAPAPRPVGSAQRREAADDSPEAKLLRTLDRVR
jgi:phage-related tail protein